MPRRNDHDEEGWLLTRGPWTVGCDRDGSPLRCAAFLVEDYSDQQYSDANHSHDD